MSFVSDLLQIRKNLFTVEKDPIVIFQMIDWENWTFPRIFCFDRRDEYRERSASDSGWADRGFSHERLPLKALSRDLDEIICLDNSSTDKGDGVTDLLQIPCEQTTRRVRSCVVAEVCAPL